MGKMRRAKKLRMSIVVDLFWFIKGSNGADIGIQKTSLTGELRKKSCVIREGLKNYVS